MKLSAGVTPQGSLILADVTGSKTLPDLTANGTESPRPFGRKEPPQKRCTVCSAWIWKRLRVNTIGRSPGMRRKETQ